MYSRMDGRRFALPLVACTFSTEQTHLALASWFRCYSVPPFLAFSSKIPIFPGTNQGLMSHTDDSAAKSVTLDFESLVARYYHSLYKFAYSLTQGEAEACDLTQQTF